MWATFDLDDARRQLDQALSLRVHGAPFAEDVAVVRCPVGFFFVRGDRAGPGKDLAEQVVASYGYWNLDAGKYFDMIFPGWGKDGETVVFDVRAFLHCRAQLEAISRWKYSGETDVLLFNVEFHREGGDGFGDPQWSFKESIWLPVEEMVRDNRVKHLDGLMHELISTAKATWLDPARQGVWEISDRVAIDRGRRALWDGLKKTFLRDVGRVYDELRPFAVCDLSQRAA